MSTGEPDYRVKAATKAGDVQDILDFFDQEATAGIRRLERIEVERLVAGGLFYVARSTKDGRIVATTYLRRQRSRDRGLEYEIGGGLVAKGIRDNGLMKCLGVCAIVAQRIATPRDRPRNRAIPEIVGRVECSNDTRIRDLLKSVGFNSKGKARLRPGTKPGLQDMPKDENGEVCVDEFAFDDTTLVNRVREVLRYRDSGELRNGQRVTTDVDILTADDAGDPLQVLLDELGG